MIDQVTPEKVTFNVLPYKFEAGTPNVVDVIGLGAAIDYLNQFDFAELEAYEDELLEYGLGLLSEIPGLKIYGNPKTLRHPALQCRGDPALRYGHFARQQGIAIAHRAALHPTDNGRAAYFRHSPRLACAL